MELKALAIIATLLTVAGYDQLQSQLLAADERLEAACYIDHSLAACDALEERSAR